MDGQQQGIGFGRSDQRRLLLATAMASRREKRIALAIAGAALMAFLIVAPFVRVRLAAVPAFIPSYEAALFFIDLVTAVLLFDLFARTKSVGLLILASGYLFDAFIVVAHALSFPGAFRPAGLLGAREQTTAWLYVFWHGGFSLFVLGYALWRRRPGMGGILLQHVGAGRAVIGSVLAMAALTIVLVLVATSGHDWLPVVMKGNDYSLLVTTGVSPAVWGLTLLAMVLLWQRELRVMDLWLMLVMWIWLFDIALAAIIGSTRFDLGFYAGRIFGLAASGFLLITLILESAQIHANALKVAASAEQRLAELSRGPGPFDIKGRKQPDEPVELFVQRQNIDRYRKLLKSGKLDSGQRRTIEKLLGEEEAKYQVADKGDLSA